MFRASRSATATPTPRRATARRRSRSRADRRSRTSARTAPRRRRASRPRSPAGAVVAPGDAAGASAGSNGARSARAAPPAAAGLGRQRVDPGPVGTDRLGLERPPAQHRPSRRARLVGDQVEQARLPDARVTERTGGRGGAAASRAAPTAAAIAARTASRPTSGGRCPASIGMARARPRRRVPAAARSERSGHHGGGCRQLAARLLQRRRRPGTKLGLQDATASVVLGERLARAPEPPEDPHHLDVRRLGQRIVRHALARPAERLLEIRRRARRRDTSSPRIDVRSPRSASRSPTHHCVVAEARRQIEHRSSISPR